jgi:hypothetical protein
MLSFIRTAKPRTQLGEQKKAHEIIARILRTNDGTPRRRRTLGIFDLSISLGGNGGGGGSRTRVRKCYWSRDYMLIRVHALGITLGRSRPSLRTDKKRQPLA